MKYETLDSKPVKEESGWMPQNWSTVLANIKEMRKHRTAVVDTIGCERLADASEPPEVVRFQHFTSLLLSAMTKDQVTAAAVNRLKKHGLSPLNISKMDEDEIGKLIYPVGFWKRKAKYLKQCATICQEEYNGDIPNTLDGLTSLPGFGPKMAHICMSVAWGEVTGIGVDTHVHRIAGWLGWTKTPAKNPEHTRIQLEEWLPHEEWRDINVLLVGFGQEICKPVYPKCDDCLNQSLCPAYNAGMIKKSPSKKRK